MLTTPIDKNVLGSESAETGVGVGEGADKVEGQQGHANMENGVGEENGGQQETGEEAAGDGEAVGDEAEVAEDDDAENEAEAPEYMEQLDADEGEENGQVVDLEGEDARDDMDGEIDTDEDGDDEVDEDRTLKQKWWDYLTT